MKKSYSEIGLRNDYTYYSFKAIKGIQAGKEYFITMIPLKLIPKLLRFDEELMGLSPELRAQRILNKSRIPKITKYLVDNYKSYVLSSLTVSIDSEITFKSLDNSEYGNFGTLLIPLDSTFIINDGQHRRAAIEEAITIRPELAYEYCHGKEFIFG